MANHQVIKNLQLSGFSMLDEAPFSESTRQEVLNFTRKKVNHSNEESKSILIKESEMYLPEQGSYSTLRILKRTMEEDLPKKTVIYRRHDSDERGLFVDIIHPDLKISMLRKEIINSTIFKSLSRTYGVSETDIEFHIYYTKNCVKPRSWHIDGPSLKIFTYLTNVKDEHGPYAYQLNSQRFYDKAMISSSEEGWINLKQLKSTVVAEDYSASSVVSVKGENGTSFISNQAGIHRGLDQMTSMERVVLVTQFL